MTPSDLRHLATLISLDDYRGECTHEEIARAMGIPKATVQWIERRALMKLRVLMKEWR